MARDDSRGEKNWMESSRFIVSDGHKEAAVMVQINRQVLLGVNKIFYT
jgi:hypothetical protein